jgi:predicted DNA-binding antitoxin AbrB/MazE fold protein
MVIRGHAEKGVIHLDEDVELKDGTRVTVEVPSGLSEETLHPDIKRLSGILPAGLNAEAMFNEPERFRSE